MHWANSSHVDSSVHGCPSGVTAGHVPPVVVPLVGHEPARQRRVALHGCPGCTHVTVAHCWESEHPSPATQSPSYPHDAPSCPGCAQVVELGQTSPGWQSDCEAHPAPTPPGGPHVCAGRLHTSPALHWWTCESHAAPLPPSTMGVQVPVAPLLTQIEPLSQSPEQLCPGPGVASQTPQASVPPSGASDPPVHALMHWPSDTQGMLAAPVPDAKSHGASPALRAQHPEVWVAATHAARPVSVTFDPGSATRDSHS